MENEIYIALISKLVEDKLIDTPMIGGPRGPRGPQGYPGENGKDFILSEHEETIKSWAKEFALKFSDLTSDEIEQIRGPRGLQGFSGKNGRDFILSEHEETIKSWAKEFALKFSDLTSDEIDKIRGPRGHNGRDGNGFIFENEREGIFQIVRDALQGMSSDLKLKFTDLSEENIQELRGPRGRDGKDGKDFIFDEHREFFESLKLKFSDLSEFERNTLKLHFSELTEEEKSSLKLKFNDLTQDEISILRGPRGARGQRGIPGKEIIGPRGVVGPRGIMGLPGIGIKGANGIDGVNGKDAPVITDIYVEQIGDEIIFIFEFSNGSVIRTDRVKLPSTEAIANSTALIRGRTTWRRHSVDIAPSASESTITISLENFCSGTFHIRLKSDSNSFKKSFKMDICYNDSELEDQIYAICGYLFNIEVAANISGGNVELVITNNELFTINASVFYNAS